MNSNYILLAAVLAILLLAIWAPWITSSYAESKAVQSFEERNSKVIDGCGLDCTDCGVKEVKRTLFGASVRIEFLCGLVLPTQAKENQNVFVSFVGTVHY